ncbi:histidine kinase [Streptomyces bambusae]|nr:histidine kinase [Streptomyces bambusae]MCB5170341.1 histidine kinase [Streptomyces bambusae]
MTETTTGGTRTQTPPPTEIRIATSVLGSFRKDMCTDVFAFRPLPPMATDGPVVRRLPRLIRAQMEWAPHAAVVLAAFLVVCQGYLYGQHGLGPVGWALTGLLPAGAVLTSLVRPVGAWWVSVVVTTVLAALTVDSWGFPWSISTFTAHLAVMVVVAARTNQRVAGWMWVLTLLLGVLLEVFGSSGEVVNTPAMAFFSGVAMAVATVVHIRNQAAQEVTAQQVVTAVERDKRTLLEERTTIARELHDVVAHHMSVVAIQAEAAPYRVENPPPELEAAFATIRENAVAALTELRRVLGVVRSADYEAPEAPQPTLATLDGLLANVREAGLPVDKTVTGAVRELPQGVELSAYRIVQEALSNVLRHAPGAAAAVEVSYVLGGLGLRVHNEAPTGDVRPSPGAGHGITGMRERVAMLEGEMTTGPTADGGYEVAVFIPVRRSGEDPA